MKRTIEPVDRMELNLKHSFEHGVNLGARTIQITGDINQETFKLVDTALTEMERQNQKSVTIRICSEGGSVYEALGVVGRIEACKCRVITEGYGCVMSAATLILAAGNKRRASRHLWFMHHESSYDADARHSEIKAYVRQKAREEDQWASMMEEYTDRTHAFWKQQGTVHDLYLSAEELLDFGVVDELF